MEMGIAVGEGAEMQCWAVGKGLDGRIHRCCGMHHRDEEDAQSCAEAQGLSSLTIRCRMMNNGDVFRYRTIRGSV